MSDLVKIEDTAQGVGIFNTGAAFEHAQRIAKMLCSSDIVPQTYKGNVPNTLVALEMANRIGASPLAVMQNMNVIHGKPSWSSTFIIASINTCGRFKPLRFDITGTGDERTCVAWTTDQSGERLEGPPVSIGMAKKEGWYGKTGSKWQTMPELMLRYRAAAFFGRLYAPEVMMGMHSEEEVIDVQHTVVGSAPNPSTIDIENLNQEVVKKPRGKKHQAPVEKKVEQVPQNNPDEELM